jgi:hypothetical protein
MPQEPEVIADTGETPDTALQVRVKNYGGEHCRQALRTVIENCNIPGLSAWRSVTANQQGNSFFATIQASIDLIRAGYLDDIYLVTGRFDHADLKEPAYHAWLEFRATKPHSVVNVTMLHERPLYGMEAAEFYKVNSCRRRIQEIPLKRLRIKARQLSERNQEKTGKASFDLRYFTHLVLKPTIEKLSPTQTGQKPAEG